MKKIRLVSHAGLFALMSALFATLVVAAAQSTSSTLTTSGGDSYNIEFLGISADGKTWEYRVTELAGKDLSHWVLGLCEIDQHAVTAYDPVADDNGIEQVELLLDPDQTDPRTGINGIKWDVMDDYDDDGQDQFDSRVFSITFDTVYAQGIMAVGIKTGGKDGVATGSIVGPNCAADSDDDGIPDAVEGDGDADDDGTPDYLDDDSDDDGIPDAVEAGDDPTDPLDSDDDGTPDYLDADSDDDGIPDAIEAGDDPTDPLDSDDDGTPDYLDLDSDDDGILDAGEYSNGAQDPLAGCIVNDPLCIDNDIDGDGIPNYLDTDSDADGAPDSIEGTGDSDLDGIPDYLDNTPVVHTIPYRYFLSIVFSP